MASVYGVVQSLFESVPRAPSLRRMLRRKSDLRGFDYNMLVEREIVPRLMMSHASQLGRTIDPMVDRLSFAPLALGGDAASLLQQAEHLLEEGYTVDELMLDILAPAARNLGVMWEDDSVDFVQVTMALWRLQEVVREISARVPAACLRHAPRVLFSVMPGEQHSFGTVIVEDVFRRHGWATDILTECDRAQLLRQVGEHHYDVIGLTVSADQFAPDVAGLVRALRGVSVNTRAAIMLGGRVFADGDARMAASFGADAVTGDAREALHVANAYVDALRVSG